MIKVTETTTGANWVRIGNIQICWGLVKAAAGKDAAVMTYPVPFSEQPTVTAAHAWNNVGIGKVTIGSNSNTSTDIRIYDYENDITLERSAFVIAIGRWK